MKRSFCYLFLLFIAAQGYAQVSPTKPLADSIRKYRNTPGLVYAVFTSDKIIDSGASGIKKMQVRDFVQFSNRFNIGTTTTAFTSYIAAKMVQEGKISWNTTVVKAIPELDGKIMKLYNRVTLQQLLGQRAGFPPFEEFKEYKEIHSMQGSPTQQRLAFATMMMKKRPTLIVDSSEAVYSVAGTSVAAAMLEKVSKKSWEQLVDQYINKPLNIKADFGFPVLKDSTQPWGHWDNYMYLSAHMDDYWARCFPPIAPSGNINIRMSDFIVFIRDHLNALQNKKASITATQANQLLFDKPGYSIGWANMRWNNLLIAYWSGRGGLFSSYVEIIKEKNIAIVVMDNSGAVDGRSAASNLGRALRNYYVR